MSDEILSKISEAVEDAVDLKINGKLISIKDHLNRQDVDMVWMKWAVKGIMAGIGAVFVALIINFVATKL